MLRSALLLCCCALLSIAGLLTTLPAGATGPGPLPTVEPAALLTDAVLQPDALLPLLFDPASLLGELDPLGGLLGPTGIIGGVITPTPGTEVFTGTMAWGGITRSYAGIRPIGAPAGAPVLMLLHPRAQSPARTANLTRAGRLAADYGAWVYLPAAVAAIWADHPTTTLVDDVGFLNALVAREVAANGLDGRRVYAAGYSNGGFMVQRLACERPELLAGIAIVAATIRDAVASRCTGPRRIPVVMFNGTLDLLTPYDGSLGQTGAPATAAFWAERNQCVPGDIGVTRLPDRDTRDGTTVTVSRYSRCVDSTVALYTINNGGHTWPGTELTGYTLGLGPTSGDVDATIELWRQLTPYARR